MLETYQYFSQLPLWELVAVFTSIAYVVLAAKEDIWCWPAALISTVIYTVIFYDVYLWMDSLLQVYYFIMAVYGWYCWRKHVAIAISEQETDKQQLAKQKSTQSVLQIQSWSLVLHLKIISVLTVTSLFVGWLMANYTPTSFPYLDSVTTVFAVFATYLVAQKVLENWLYWIVIDLVSIYLYIEKGLVPTAALFILFVIMASYGYLKWSTKYKEKNMSQPVNSSFE